MSPNDDTPTTGTAGSDRASSGGSGHTRRDLLQTGFAAGVAATSLGGFASTSAAAESSEDGPAAPENVRVDWHLGGPVGLVWDWPEDRCASDLSHFDVRVEDDDGRSEHHVIPPQQRAFSVGFESRDTTVSVRAVDEQGRASEAIEEHLGAIAVDLPQYVLEPAIEPELSAPERTTVPIELQGVPEQSHLIRYELQFTVPATCVATIEHVRLPDDLDMDVVERTWDPDGSEYRIVVEGSPRPGGLESPVALVEILGVEHGGTVLEVSDEEILVLEDTPEVEAWKQYQASPEDPPVSVSDLLREVDAFDRWTTVTVGDPSGPAPPENFRIGYWISASVGLTWDWEAGVCDDELSHFHVTLHDSYDREDRLLEERTVPAERPVTTVEPEYLLQSDDTGDRLLVSVYAVDEFGRRSEPVWEVFSPWLADPAYTLDPSESPTLTARETTTVPVTFGEVLGEPVGITRCELDVSIAGPCVATISDVTVSREEWEIVETEWEDDDSAVTVVAEGPPPDREDYYHQELIDVEVEGEAPGETVFDVQDVELVALEEPFEYSNVEHVRYVEEEYGEEEREALEYDVEDMTQTVRATNTWSTVSVTPPPVVDDQIPRDLDGDGLYRDVNGDGSVSNGDVVDFFGNQHTAIIDDYPGAYDFTGDGDVSQADVIDLFEYL